MRFEDGTIDKDGKFIICVYEDHTGSDQNAINGLARLNPDPGKKEWNLLISGLNRDKGDVLEEEISYQ